MIGRDRSQIRQKARKASNAMREVMCDIEGGVCVECDSFEVVKTNYKTKPYKFYCNKKGLFVDPLVGCEERRV